MNRNTICSFQIEGKKQKNYSRKLQIIYQISPITYHAWPPSQEGFLHWLVVKKNPQIIHDMWTLHKIKISMPIDTDLLTEDSAPFVGMTSRRLPKPQLPQIRSPDPSDAAPAQRLRDHVPRIVSLPANTCDIQTRREGNSELRVSPF